MTEKSKRNYTDGGYLVPQQVALGDTVDLAVIEFNEARAQKESLIEWANNGVVGELRPDTTPKEKTQFGQEWASFIHQFWL